ncbi:GH25 family lysozyme, partial [Clostridium neonatale]|uniref:GH25 family lysozyme n=1 Tax=Clostridium neonatale TaxID=137838 RepID=UPI00397C0CD0
GHAMLCIGYKEDTLIIINSWGDYNGDKGKYYLDISSSIIKELWVLEDKKQVKEPEKLKYKVGWNKDNKGWWFSTDGETYCKEEWKQIKGEYYYFNKEGYALDGEWIQSPTSKKWYYLEKDTCKMLSNCWVKSKGLWYRLEKDGSMLTGWFQDSDSKWYYLDIAYGYMYSSTTILIDGEYYSFDSSGAWIEKKKFKGIDVSNNNGNINFNKVKASGIECVYIKATEGTTYKDGCLDTNYNNAHSVGLKTGFYHFLVGASAPETQAINFYNAIKNKSNDLIPMLDIETNFNGLIDYAERFIKKFKELSNMKIGIYTYTGFLSNLKGKLTDYLLWEANYNNTPWKLPNNSYTRVGHQYTEKGKVNGIEGSVDMNEFTNNIFCK